MPFRSSTSYKSYPFVRLIIPFITGIVLQWHLPLQMKFIISAFAFTIFLLIGFNFISKPFQFSLRWIRGAFIFLLILIMGVILMYVKDIRHAGKWFEKWYTGKEIVLITIEEPLIEKPKTFKALCSVTAIKKSEKWQPAKGYLLVYFNKENFQKGLHYGSQILVHKPLQPITNSGNPGSFDYKRYSLFHGITRQVFLSNNQFVVLHQTKAKSFRKAIYEMRDRTIAVIKKYIPDKKQQGVAEALLVGYRNDLDKELVQSYSNTGVVHIIAISGLHLGMIYLLMLKFFSIFRINKKTFAWLKPLLILIVIWLFAFITGSPPSVLRAAVMLTLVILADATKNKNYVYNALAASAFCLLVWNPFFLWDVGFQLSYAAVLSIVSFRKSIYNWFYIKNENLNSLWKISAVTISAQVLTMPLILYYFHQFSYLFLITNIVVVPLSGIILYAEVSLLLVSFSNTLAGFLGTITGTLIQIMNWFIESVNKLPNTLLNSVQLSFVEALLLLCFIVLCIVWLLNKNKYAFTIALIILTIYSACILVDKANIIGQKKLVVYNIPKHTAIDCITGKHCIYVGDSSVLLENQLKNFHLKPARIQYQTTTTDRIIFPQENTSIKFEDKRILLLKHAVNPEFTKTKTSFDVIILSQADVSISDLLKVFDFKELVCDSSNPLWKIEKWKKECSSLHLPLFSVPEQGAYILDL